jgi:hypothetical protein
VEIRLLYRPPDSSIYRVLELGDYGLDVFEGVCSDLLSLYDEVFFLGDFNVDLLYPGHVLFKPFSDLLETFMMLLFCRRGGCLLNFWTCSWRLFLLM